MEMDLIRLCHRKKIDVPEKRKTSPGFSKNERHIQGTGIFSLSRQLLQPYASGEAAKRHG